MSWKHMWARVRDRVGESRAKRLEDERMAQMRKLGSERLSDVAEYLAFVVSGGAEVLPMPEEAKWPKK